MNKKRFIRMLLTSIGILCIFLCAYLISGCCGKSQQVEYAKGNTVGDAGIEIISSQIQIADISGYRTYIQIIKYGGCEYIVATYSSQAISIIHSEACRNTSHPHTKTQFIP